MREDILQKINHHIPVNSESFQKKSFAPLVLALVPLLVFIAIAYFSVKQPTLAIPVSLLVPAVFIFLIHFAANKGGQKIAFLAGLIAALYITSVHSSLPPQFDLFEVRAGLAVLSMLAAFVFVRTKQQYVTPAPIEPILKLIETDTVSPYMDILTPSTPKFELGAIEQLPLGVLVLEAENKNIAFTNLSLKEIFGNFENISDLQKIKFFNSEGQEISFDKLPISMVLQDGKQRGFENFSLEREDEERIAFRMSASPVYYEKENIIGSLALVEKSSEVPVPLARQEDFMDIARAELGPQLSRLDRYVNVLKLHVDKNSDEHAAAIIRRLEIQFRRLDHGMQRLLQFARIDFEEMPFKIETFDVIKLLNETIETIQRSSLDHQIVFLPQTTSFAHGDRFRIRKVFDHLMKNAIKYSPLGGKVVVTLIENEGMLIISIRDFGTGIDEEKLVRMEKAFSVKENFARRKGLGIGLYTSNEIIRRIGGKMGVRGKRGKGTEFYFTISSVPHQESEAKL